MDRQFDLLVVIVNRGYSDVVMDIVRPLGATGGTILHGKGSGSKEMQKFFNILIHEEKEVILIVADRQLRERMMLGIMAEAGLATKASGVVFTLPVEQFEILRKHHEAQTAETVKEETEEEQQ